MKIKKKKKILLTCKNDWKTVKKRRQRIDPKIRPMFIEGKKDVPCALKAVVLKNYSWIFVSRLSTNTTCEDITNYIKLNCNTDCECELMRTKGKQRYNSYKVGIPTDKKAEVLDENFWPIGIYVNNFLNLRNVVSQQGQN